MPCVIRIAAGVALVVCSLVALLAAAASAAGGPPGPRLTFLRATAHSYQLVSVDGAGHDQQVLAGGGKKSRPVPNPFSAPAWSGNGAIVAFSAISRWTGGHLDIYRAAADGSNLRKLPHTRDAFKPVLSPDGRRLAFAVLRQRQQQLPNGREVTTFAGAATWLLRLGGGSPRRLTPWRNGLYEYPSSFSPDGRTLGISLTQQPSAGKSSHSALALQLKGKRTRVIAKNAGSPVFSPDGTRVALLLMGKPRTVSSHGSKTTITPSDLAVAAADGSGLVRLTHTGALELQPSWDPSGQRLAYIEQRASARRADVTGVGDAIMEINADGSCRTRLLSSRGTILSGPTWQPGPGREAGAIAC